MLKKGENNRLMKTEVIDYLDLSFHGDTEKRDEIHDEDWPEHGDVEQLEESAEERYRGGLGGGVPELELRQPPDEGAELLVLGGGKPGPVLVRLVLRHRGVDLRGEEGQQQV